MLRTLITLFFALFGLADSAKAQDEAIGSTQVPLPVGQEHFQQVKQNSPFLRSLNLSDSLILTGVATVNTELIATLMDRNTKQSYVVSSTPNAQGWKMVNLDGSLDLESVTATISVDDLTTVKVRYDNMRLKSGEGKPAAGDGSTVEPGKGKSSGRGDGGDRRGPSSEMREKMMALSEEQRGKLFQKMMELREKKPDMSREERTEVMTKTLEKMTNKN